MSMDMIRVLPDGTSVTGATWEVVSDILLELNVLMAATKPQTTIPAVRTFFSRLKALQAL